MLLTVDAGNTRTKWAVFNKAGEMKHHGACLNEVLTASDLSLSSLAYDHVVISNVAGESHAALLVEKLAADTLPVRWIKATSQACGVRNAYLPAETLGSDRWAALIAAWHIKQAPCVVVNAGTAVTIDALHVKDVLHVNQGENNNSQAEFIGGLILPGLNLMQQSLGLATAKLPKTYASQNSTSQTHTEIFAKNTADAIYAGALHAIAGAITLMAHELNALCKQTPYIVISGGNSSIIYNQLIKENLPVEMTDQALIVDNLVLQGLYLLDNFMQSDSQ